jgi:hypothetical protein
LVDALGGAGDCGILQAKGVIGGGKSLPSTATSGSATKASSTTIAKPGSSILDPGISLVPALAKFAFDRDTRDGAGMAPQGVESLLALAIATSRKTGTKNDSTGSDNAHSSHGD